MSFPQRQRKRAPLGDVLWASTLMMSPIFGFWIQTLDGFNVWTQMDVLLGVVIAVAGAFRRTKVLSSAVITYTAFAFYAVLHMASPINLGLDPILFAAPASLWALTRWGAQRWWGIAGLFTGLAGSFLNPAIWDPPGGDGSFADRWLPFGLPAVFITVLAYVIPAYIRTRGDQHEAEVEAKLANQRVLLARELHDVVGHGLSSIKVMAQTASYLGTTEGTLEKIAKTAGDSLGEIRVFGEALDQPKASADQIRQVIAMLPLAFNVDLSDAHEAAIESLPGIERFVLLRCVQETVTNMMKYASAGTLTLRVDQRGYLLEVIATPKGNGLKAEHDGSGLANMKARLESVGGTIVVDRGPQFHQVIEVRL